MRYILLVFLLFSTLGDGLKKAARVNTGVQQAHYLYGLKKYEQAAGVYRFLNDSLSVKDDELVINLAHATYQAGQIKQAQKYYQRLRNNANPQIQAAALNQLGILSFEEDNPEKALYYFKRAIIQEPSDDVARYNYELVQKYQAQNPVKKNSKSKGQKQEQPAPENKKSEAKAGQKESPGGNPDYQNDFNNSGKEPAQQKPQSTPGNNPGENQRQPANQGQAEKLNQGTNGGDKKGLNQNNQPPDPNSLNQGSDEAVKEKERQMQTLRQRLSKTDLTPEKATMLLDAMRQAELQYLQQLPRQPAKRIDKDKPDW